MITIKHCNGIGLYVSQTWTIRAAIKEALRAGANLSGAYLYRANLRGADLYGASFSGAVLEGADLIGADLSRADLSGANLRGADLRGANLRWADFRGADLEGANLSGAYLRVADLHRANLKGANLAGADLRGANLAGADLREAKLDAIRDDLWAVLDLQPTEVPGLLEALRAGRIDGSYYEGECACLIGTIARVAGKPYRRLSVMPMASRPAERWFLALSPGDTPFSSQVAAITEEWIVAWQARREGGVA